MASGVRYEKRRARLCKLHGAAGDSGAAWGERRASACRSRQMGARSLASSARRGRGVLYTLATCSRPGRAVDESPTAIGGSPAPSAVASVAGS